MERTAYQENPLADIVDEERERGKSSPVLISKWQKLLN
jgi:hypothetical protein